jgi:hypothetical protein
MSEHVIIFKAAGLRLGQIWEMEGRLAVISILHENMDMITRLREDGCEEKN